MGSSEGGVEIEQVAATNPAAIQTVHADPYLGLEDWQARQLAFAMGLGRTSSAAVSVAKGLVRTMLAYDADLVEINPLAVVREPGRRTGPWNGWSAWTPRSRSTTPRSRATRTSSSCATSTRRTRPTPPKSRYQALSSFRSARSAAWSTAPVWVR